MVPSFKARARRTPRVAFSVATVATTFLIVAVAVFAAPFDPNLAAKIDSFLHEELSPLEGNGQAFVDSGVRHNVDPRLIVAIAGAESTFGTKWAACRPEGFNAWSWFWNGDCPSSPFDSYAQGIETVTKFIRLRYFNERGQRTIEAIAHNPNDNGRGSYCQEGCEHWVGNVKTAYQALGGDVSDLTYRRSEMVLDFEKFTGPSIFSGITPPLHDDIATISGGQLLNGATNLPADPSVVYGTAYFCAGCLPTITIDFSQPVSGFSVYLYNGLPMTITYSVEGDQGEPQPVTLISNLDGGQKTVFIAASGLRRVVVRSESSTTWDFLIDNVRYTAEPGAVPQSSPSQRMARQSTTLVTRSISIPANRAGREVGR